MVTSESQRRGLPIATIAAHDDDALDDLRGFLSALPLETGAAYAVVVPRSRLDANELAHALRTMTTMPVMVLSDRHPLEADVLHLAPPHSYVSLRDGVALLTPFEAERAHAPVDWVLRSLAEDRGASSIAVVLGAGGVDGSAGLLEIKLQGGLALVQDPVTIAGPAQQGAVAHARNADFVQSPAELAATVTGHVRCLHVRRQP